MLKTFCGNYVPELAPTLLYVIPVNCYIIVAIRTRLFMVEAQGMTWKKNNTIQVVSSVDILKARTSLSPTKQEPIIPKPLLSRNDGLPLRHLIGSYVFLLFIIQS